MTIARGFRYKPEPLSEQEALFRQFAGVCRPTYNLALEQRASWGGKHRLGYVAQATDLTRLRAEFDWIMPATCPAGSRRSAISTERSGTSSRMGRPSLAPAAAGCVTAPASPGARSR